MDDLARRAAGRLGTRPVPVRESGEIRAPVTAGWLHPLVLLPSGLAEALHPSHFELLLSHELSHVMRRDYLTNVLQSVGDALTLHSPGHRWMSSEIRRLREEACDDAVVASGADRHAYAVALEQLADLSGRGGRALPVCAANRDLAERVQRLVGARPTRGLNRGRAITACALFIAGALMAMVVTAASQESVAHAKAARESQLPGEGIVHNPIANGARQLEKFPTGWAFAQDGSPVRIEGTNPSAEFVFQTVTVKDTFPKGITSVTFGAFVDSQGTQRVSLTRSNPIRAAIEPGQSQILAADLFPVDRMPEVRALGSRGLLMLGVLEVTFEDGSRWSAQLDESAKSFNAALGIPNATVPRSYVSASAPPPPPGGRPVLFCYYGESEIDVTSEGGVMEIAGEPGKVTTCVNGRWVEGYQSVQTPEPRVRVQEALRATAAD